MPRSRVYKLARPGVTSRTSTSSPNERNCCSYSRPHFLLVHRYTRNTHQLFGLIRDPVAVDFVKCLLLCGHVLAVVEVSWKNIDGVNTVPYQIQEQRKHATHDCHIFSANSQSLVIVRESSIGSVPSVLQTVRVRARRVHLLKSTDSASGSMSAFFAPHRPRVGGSMTESYTVAGQVLRSSEKACLRSPASRDRNTRRFDSASISARVEKSCWLGRSQPGVSLAFNHLPTDAGSVVKYDFQ